MLLPHFKARFARVRFQRYGEQASAIWYGELWQDANWVRGFHRDGLSYKCYERTNRRLRIEADYSRVGLSRCRAPVSLMNNGGESILLRDFLAERCLPQINAMLQRARAVSTDDRSVYQLFAAIAPIFSRSDPEELELYFAR